MIGDFPSYIHFPRWKPVPGWAEGILNGFRRHRDEIDTVRNRHLTSDEVLATVRPDLESIGFTVEKGKKGEDKIHRPVLFGDSGAHEHKYEIDAWHPDLKIVMEVEAGRGAKGNAFYKDLIHMSLMVDARAAVVALPIAYKHAQGEKTISVPAYDFGKSLLEAIYTSRRLELPFEGVLLIGY